jgi:hypothetical protein
MLLKAVRAVAWIVAVLAAFFVGFVVHETRVPPYGATRAVYEKATWIQKGIAKRLFGEKAVPGRWRRSESVASGSLSAEQVAAVEQLASLGYASGTQSAADAPVGGVSRHDPDRAFEGLNLVVSGHAPEAVLMDMEGAVLHRWSCDYWTAFPDTDVPRDLEPVQFWRRARLLDGGRILVVFEGHGLVELDAASNVVWTYPGRAHHDLDLDEQGRIWALTREIEFLPRIDEDRPVLEDYVTLLSREGEEIHSISVLEAFERSEFASFLPRRQRAGDIFHTNSVEILDGSQAERCPAFRKGNLLISIHRLDVIAVLDPERETIVWAMAGMWKRQHDPRLLANGHILLFDNQGCRGMSKVIEFDPLTQEIAWAFEGTPENGFYTEFCGASQRLPNGNTLITESESGRAFEVAPDGAIVWKYDSPHRAGPEGKLIATLLDVVRLDPATPTPWAAGG